MKRALIITYYWPPAGGSGVQRWLKFVKYLRHFGWEPVVFTPENPENPVTDPELEKDIPEGLETLRIPISEPYKWYRALSGRKEPVSVGFTDTKGTSSTFANKAARWVRGNFFIPDARKSWVGPAVRYLDDWLRSNPVDVIITTGPPHSIHLIGQKLKASQGIPWVADFRDPWTGIDFYDDLLLTRSADRKHRKLERDVLEQADLTVTVSGPIKKELIQKGGKNVMVITNGFDPDDFSDFMGMPTNKFTITHSGSLIPSRNPELLWEVLASLCESIEGFRDDLEIKLIGLVDSGTKASLEKSGLAGNARNTGYMPHQQAIRELFGSQLLLLLINRTRNAEGFLTGKLFEYLATGRPILCIGPEDGAAAELITQTQSGFTAGFDGREKLAHHLSTCYNQWKTHGKIPIQPKGIDAYSRKTLTQQLASSLNGLTT